MGYKVSLYITNIPEKVIYLNILPWPSISDHDA